MILIIIITLIVILIISSNIIEKFQNTIIPKKIYQTYGGLKGDPIPYKIQKNINYIKKQNPDYQYKLYRDDMIERFILKHYNQKFLSYYQQINPEYGAARADFFRYLLIYKKGGVYLDIKSAASKPFNQIIKKNDTFLSCHWKAKSWAKLLNYPNGEIHQWHIISKPKHPFLKKVIQNTIHNIKNYQISKTGTGKLAVLKTTGPLMYSKSIIPLINKYPNRILDSQDQLYLIYDNIGKKLGDHESLFKKHYSNVHSPLILKKKYSLRDSNPQPLD